jgi:ribosomal protein L28
MGNKRISYATSFELEVAQYAKKHSKRPTGRKFEVNEQHVREWCEQKGRLENVLKSKREFQCKQRAFSEIKD